MLVYLAHAVGKDPVKRAENIARVQRWFKWLIDFGPESWTFHIPWLPYVQNLDEETYRERGIRDGQLSIKLYDIIVLVGGSDTMNSVGAQAEAQAMRLLKRGVCDLTFLGAEPPRAGFLDTLPFASQPSVEYAQTREDMTSLILRHLRR